MRQPKKDSSRNRGPCNHCGIESTPQWRPGPDYKPVLCNSCGSRWRIKENLINYIPMHGLAEGYETEVKTDGSANSSSKSVVENGNSGIVQPNFWNSSVPRRKRSALDQNAQTPIVMLNRQLEDILHQPEFSYLLEEEEEVLIWQNLNNQIPSGEIGPGCVLLKPSSSTNE